MVLSVHPAALCIHLLNIYRVDSHSARTALVSALSDEIPIS